MQPNARHQFWIYIYIYIYPLFTSELKVRSIVVSLISGQTNLRLTPKVSEHYCLSPMEKLINSIEISTLFLREISLKNFSLQKLDTVSSVEKLDFEIGA